MEIDEEKQPGMYRQRASSLPPDGAEKENQNNDNGYQRQGGRPYRGAYTLPHPHETCHVQMSPTLQTHPSGRSMQNGLSTTVPQNLVQNDLNCSHRPSKPTPRKATGCKESCEMKCCRINVLLVTMQCCLGIVITALGFYMATLTSSIKTRELTHWAGIPLLVAGILGIYFCATDFEPYSGTLKAFVVKTLCFSLSAICVFICVIAGVFAGIHGSQIALYAECVMKDSKCLCLVSKDDPYSRIYFYEEVDSCLVVQTSVKDYLILQCALNTIGCGICFWFVTLLWKSRNASQLV